MESIEKNGAAYKRILVRPAVDFSSLEEVLVVLTPTPARRGRRGGAPVKSRRGHPGGCGRPRPSDHAGPRFLVRGTIAVDLVLVVVVYVALTSGPVTGLLSGTFAGLVQDALSSGVIGIGGLAKTLVGFLAGIIGTQFIVAQPLPRFVVFFGATVLHAVVFMGLVRAPRFEAFWRPYAAVAGQATGNAVVGVVAFQLVELLPGRGGTPAARTARAAGSKGVEIKFGMSGIAGSNWMKAAPCRLSVATL